MGWFQRLGRKKHSENENYEVQTPKKSILRSTSRATSNPASFEAEEEEYDNDVGETDLSTSVSLVNLRSTSPEIRRRRNSTNRLSDYPMNGNHSDSENPEHTLNRRTVLFLDQVAAPDRNRTSRTLNIPSESANRNYSTYSGHRSPTTFSRTISPSSSSSLASYPANYEPSPLIRKKTFDDPGIELVSCTPLPYSTISQPEPTSKLQKLKSARKHLPNALNAFHKKRKDTRKPGKFMFSVNQESDGIDKNMYFYENNINNNELHQENNNNSIYEELQRLESNDESVHGVHDMFDIIENSEYYSTQGKGINRFGNSGYDQKGSTLTTTRITTPVKIDRQNPDIRHVGNDSQLNQIRVTAKNSSQSRQQDKTPTGSTETLVSMSRQLLSDDRAYYDMPLIYRNGQMTRVKLPEFSSSTLRNPEAYTDRIIDRSQSAMKASTSPTQKYNITSVSNTNNNTNNNNSHAINSQSPRIIYVSKQHTINPDLSNNAPTVNRNRVISISTMSEPSTPRMYSVHSEHKIERTYTNNQYNYTSAPMPSQMRKGSVSIIHYDTTNNHNDNSDDDYTNKREYNL